MAALIRSLTRVTGSAFSSSLSISPRSSFPYSLSLRALDLYLDLVAVYIFVPACGTMGLDPARNGLIGGLRNGLTGGLRNGRAHHWACFFVFLSINRNGHSKELTSGNRLMEAGKTNATIISWLTEAIGGGCNARLH